MADRHLQCWAEVATAALRRGTPVVERLEDRVLLSASVRLGVIGDFTAGQDAQGVATLVKSWSPDAVVTVGDNDYATDGPGALDASVGQNYHQFIAPYTGQYGAGSTTGNHFFPALGNHDWDDPTLQTYLDFFTLPNNERYYDVTVGNVEIFVLDGDPKEPDGNTATSAQGAWLKSELAAATVPWKLVVVHQLPYSSSSGHGSTSATQWPYQAWGATAVFSGHDHDYERLFEQGLPYFVDGLGGGCDIYPFATPIAGSQVRYNADYGALLVTATDTTLNVQFFTHAGVLVDSYTIDTTMVPAAPSNLTAIAATTSQIDLAWTDQANNEKGFKIERSTDHVNFVTVGTVASGTTTFSDRGLTPGGVYDYRVRASNGAGDSSPSPMASATTYLTGGVTYVSDMTWVSASNGWGPAERDMSNGNAGGGDGHTLVLNGVAYPKGIGCNATSQIVLNLSGKYSQFISDIGVDQEESLVSTVVFQVLADGVKIYDSGTMTPTTATQHLSLNVTGVTQLTLVVTDAGDGIDYDHADWGGARLLPLGTTMPTAPSVLTATAASSSQITLAWTNNASNDTGIKIERSLDGTTFSQVALTAAHASGYVDIGLTPGTKYYYRVRATNTAGDSGYSNLANATTTATVLTTYLSDLAWASATVGWGTVHQDASIKGTTLTLNGTPYAKGLGTHATSQIVYNLAGQYTAFLADIGVDDEVGSNGSVVFQILADGVKIYDSGTMTGASATQSLSLSVKGVNQLTLLATDAGDGIDYDHADWANARLTTTTQTVPVAPSALTATAVSVSQITLSWTNNASDDTGIKIERSLDGTAFTQIALTAAHATSFTDTALTPGTKYYYRARAAGSNGDSAYSNTANATTLVGSSITYLNDLTWASATVGWGTVHKNASIKGTTLTLNGVTYSKGIGTHASSQIVYNLAGQYATFLTDIGIDDEVSSNGSVVFQVWGDGVKLYDSGTMTGASATQSLNLSVKGVLQLTLLVTDASDGIDYDHADWANARLSTS